MRKGYVASDEEIEGRFWNKINKGSDDECWLWTGATTKKGYGQLRVKGRIILSHRIAWELFYSFIPDGLKVLHTCDNPPCVNPSHLFLGTQLDNMQDMVAKGRSRFGRGNGRTGPRGQNSKHTGRKLEEHQIFEIIEACKIKSYRKVAIDFGISHNTVSDIMLGNLWGWLTGYGKK